MHDVGQRVGIIDSGWDFAFAKLFYNIRYSGMCKNHDFLSAWMRKMVCGLESKTNIISNKNFTIWPNTINKFYAL